MWKIIIQSFLLESIYGFHKDTNCPNSTITNTICIDTYITRTLIIVEVNSNETGINKM